MLDGSLAAFGLEAVLRDVVLPMLRQVGLEMGPPHAPDRPGALREQPDTRPAARAGPALGSWNGPLAILACAPGEVHDIGLIAFGFVVRSHGWPILFLGADTPGRRSRRRPRRPDRRSSSSSASTSAVWSEAADLEHLSRVVQVALAGPGAGEVVCRRLGARRLTGDVIFAAGEVAAPAEAG